MKDGKDKKIKIGSHKYYTDKPKTAGMTRKKKDIGRMGVPGKGRIRDRGKEVVGKKFMTLTPTRAKFGKGGHKASVQSTKKEAKETIKKAIGTSKPSRGTYKALKKKIKPVYFKTTQRPRK